MSHTKEPWEVGVDDEDDNEYDINATNADGWYVTLAMNLSRDNARRIVACVNACAGMSIEDVERWAARGGFSNLSGLVATCNQAAGMLAAQQQRDELLAALQGAAEIIAETPPTVAERGLERVEEIIGAAIMKFKGGT